MKRILSCILCLALFISLFAACGETPAPDTPAVTDTAAETTETTQKSRNQKITTADELIEAMKNPDEKYTLGANIDLGGMEWTPVDFTGSLSGLWGGAYNYTISNFTLKAKPGDTAVGFFGNCTGKLMKINFADVTVEIEDGFTGDLGAVIGHAEMKSAIEDVEIKNLTVKGSASGGSIGALVGSATGELKECYADGSMELTLAGNAEVGGLVGSAGKVNDSESRVGLTVDTKSGTAVLGGVAGKLDQGTNVNYGGHLTASAVTGAQLSAAPLCGELSGFLKSSYACARTFDLSGDGALTRGEFNASGDGSIMVCYTRDVSNLDETTLSADQLALRQAVVDYMYLNCTIPWYTDRELTYTDDCGGSHDQTFRANQWYFGLPYCHSTGSVEKFRYYLNEDGSLSHDVPADNYADYIGNDCSDAAFWAFQEASSSMTCFGTKNMISVEGLLPVGSYACEKDGVKLESTQDICTLNGLGVMAEAYAALKMGDMIGERTAKGGHVRLVAEAPTIVRREDGSVNPDASYFLYHEQGYIPGCKTRNSTCRINQKMTFTEAFGEYYIPETVAEYETGVKAPLTVGAEFSGSTFADILTAKVSSNYKIKSFRLVAESGGKTVWDSVVYPFGHEGFHTFTVGEFLTEQDLSPLSGCEQVTCRVFVNDALAKELSLTK